MTAQEQMKQTLTRAGLPFKQIECYGSQIVITSHCLDTANKWASLLAKFAKVRGVVETLDYCAVNRNTVLRPSTTKVWRTFARV